jgi:leader peptidase (prepilin peptidase) / N-methyltransferase
VATFIFSLAAFVFGTAIGSFLNVVIWRLPQERSLGGRSECPHCHVTLKPRNLIPLFSYLIQGRRCASCRQYISSRYFLIELITGLTFAFTAYQFSGVFFDSSMALTLARLLFIIAILIVVFVIDLEHYLILDVVVFPAAIIVLILNFGVDLINHQAVLSLASHTGGGIVAALLASGFFYLIWLVSRGRWMGFGDVKFNLFLGLALGWPGVIVALLLAFFLGSVVGVGLIVFGQKQLSSRVPFGTFLSLAALFTLFYGSIVASWYLHLISWS